MLASQSATPTPESELEMKIHCLCFLAVLAAAGTASAQDVRQEDRQADRQADRRVEPNDVRREDRQVDRREDRQAERRVEANEGRSQARDPAQRRRHHQPDRARQRHQELKSPRAQPRSSPRATAQDAQALIDRNQNVLVDLAKLLPNDGIERQVRFRGAVDARIQRNDEGELRARIEGIDLGSLTPAQRADLARQLATKAGLDRLRIRGTDATGARVRVEFRDGRGIVKNEGRADRNAARGDPRGNARERSASRAWTPTTGVDAAAAPTGPSVRNAPS